MKENEREQMYSCEAYTIMRDRKDGSMYGYDKEGIFITCITGYIKLRHFKMIVEDILSRGDTEEISMKDYYKESLRDVNQQSLPEAIEVKIIEKNSYNTVLYYSIKFRKFFIVKEFYLNKELCRQFFTDAEFDIVKKRSIILNELYNNFELEKIIN